MVTGKEKKRKRIAIACQGGGSHTAFTALSGASGGAICALLTWYGLLTNDRDRAIRYDGLR